MRRNLEEVAEAFPPAVDVVPTAGVQAGVILKYHGYYMKVYDRLHADYTVIGYLNGHDQPMFVHNVEQRHLRQYARAFAMDRIPCEFPYATPAEMP